MWALNKGPNLIHPLPKSIDALPLMIEKNDRWEYDSGYQVWPCSSDSLSLYHQVFRSPYVEAVTTSFLTFLFLFFTFSQVSKYHWSLGRYPVALWECLNVLAGIHLPLGVLTVDLDLSFWSSLRGH